MTPWRKAYKQDGLWRFCDDAVYTFLLLLILKTIIDHTALPVTYTTKRKH